MRRFTQLYSELDRTTRTNEKLAALKQYFEAAPPEDAAWALHFLSGRRLKRALSGRVLFECAIERTGLPDWLIAESRDQVGDTSETLALILPEPIAASDLPLHQLVRAYLEPLPKLSDAERKQIVFRAWDQLDSGQRLVFHKLISGTFRIGVARTLVVRALSEVAGVSAAVMEHRLLSDWRPTAQNFRGLLSADIGPIAATQPYPFYLAYPLESAATDLGPIEQWQVEWKWDGLRAQIIRRGEHTLIWSRGEELINSWFPELVGAASALPDGTVLDGEIVGWERERPLPFLLLQRRIGRKQEGMRLFEDVPVAFFAFDLLEEGGRDVRELALAERRSGLERVLGAEAGGGSSPLFVARTGERLIRGCPVFAFESWESAARVRSESRAAGVEGLMLKRKRSTYGVGRVKGDWWKWKVEPHTLDAVLMYAQPGSGRRAGLLTDYTFGVWAALDEKKGSTGHAAYRTDGRELVPVAKAYSGLTDAEIRELDAYIKRHTLEKRGPVRLVRPERVFELGFEAIQPSTRHRAGVAVRFPRILRARTDKKPEDANTIEELKELMKVRD